MSDDVGGIFVTVTPDLSGFREELQSGLEADARGSDVRVPVHFDADEAEFDTTLDSVDRKGKSFGAQTYRPTFDADDTDLRAKLDENQQRAEALAHETVTMKLSADDAEARADLAALQQKAADLVAESYPLHVTSEGMDQTRSALDDLEAKIDELSHRTATPGVKLNGDTDALARLAAVTAAIDALKNKVGEARVDVQGDALAQGKLSAMEAALERLGKRVASPSIDLEGVADTEAKFAVLDAKLDEFNARSASAKVSVDGADSASSDLDKAGKSADNASNDMNKLVGAAIAVGPALIPIGAAAIAGIGGIAAIAASAGAGIGAFALAASGDFKNIETSAKTMLASFQQENQGIVLPALANVLPILQAGFTDIEPLVQGAATAIGKFGAEAESALTSPFWKSFFQLLGGQAEQSLTTFGNLAIGVATALAGLDRAFAPVITDIEGGLDRMAVAMEHFGATAGTNSGLQSFVAYIEQEGPQVLHVLEEFGSDFATLAQDAGALGPSFLTIIGAAAELLGDLERLNPQLTELAIVALSAYKAFQLLSPLVGIFKDIGNLSSLFSGTAEADTAATGLGRAAVAAGQFRDGIMEAGAASINAAVEVAAVGEAAEGTGVKLEATAAGAEAAGAELEGAGAEARLAGAGFSAALGVIGLLAAGMVELTHVLGASGAAAGAAGKAIGTDLVQKVSSSGQTLAQQITTIKTANDGLAEQMNVLAKNGGFTSDAFSKLANEYKTNEAAIKSLTDQEQANAQYSQLIGTTANTSAGQVANLTDKTQLLQQAMTAAANAQRTSVAQAFQALNGDITTQTSDLSNLSAALNVLVGNYLSAKSATLNQEIALDSLSSSIKAANGDLTGNTAASRQAQESATTWAQSLYSTLIPALVNNGDSAKEVASITQGLIGQFDNAALGSHATAAQVAALNEQYGLTPHDVKTTIELIGASGVISAVESAKAELDSIAHTYTATVQETTIEQTIIHSRIPGNAAGTSFHPGGLSWVGEQGPELVDLPRGSKVVPNGQSMQMARAGMVPSPPGYADGVGLDGDGLGGIALGRLFGTRFNAGLDQALASDRHTVTIAGGSGPAVSGAPAAGGKWPGTSGGFGGLAWNPQAAASSVATLTDSLSASVTKSLTTASDDIAKGLQGSMAQLTSYVNDAVSTVNKDLGGTGLDKIVDALGENFDYLSSKAKVSLASVSSQLSAAQSAVASIKQEISQNASNLEGQFSVTGITGQTFTNPNSGSTWTAPVSGANIIASLQADVASLRTYRNLLDTLKTWGLSPELLAQLVSAGPASGMAAAQALVAGGKKEVNLADVLQGQIDSTSTQIATISATATISGKTVGLSQAEGIVSSLEASKTKITTELDKLATDMKDAITKSLQISGGKSGTFKTLGDQMMAGIQQGIDDSNGPLKAELEQVAKSMEAAIKAALGIKSPSTVFAEVGTNIIQGLAQGIAGAQSTANDALEGVWDGLTAKSKQKALAFDGGTLLPGNIGSGLGGASITYAPSVTVQGDVGPEKFEAKVLTLLKNDRADFVGQLQREIGKF